MKARAFYQESRLLYGVSSLVYLVILPQEPILAPLLLHHPQRVVAGFLRILSAHVWMSVVRKWIHGVSHLLAVWSRVVKRALVLWIAQDRQRVRLEDYKRKVILQELKSIFPRCQISLQGQSVLIRHRHHHQLLHL
ncbi:Uncharacterised protein [Chlamydia abortus]|nr:Uncharacterised protein [Chlamydia abortus]